MTRCTEAVPQCMGRVNFGECHCPAQETRRTSARQQDIPTIWVQFSECGQHIRKWSREPFEDGEQFATKHSAAEAVCPECGFGLVAGYCRRSHLSPSPA